ncbi:hypothetical protein [Ruminococcus flavefaciens]|uniref:hypothetical protein n=1 Tax=Ruminococcus flavefaciens TaxID=1265 RepID=UPI0026EE9861|nr:hypothetical protein [Ruminococcus flavefaciens]
MTLTEQFIKDAVSIDTEAEIEYSSEEIGCGCGPCRVPYVRFKLKPTNELIQIADRIRHDEGFKTIKPIKGITDEVEEDGRYDFYVYISKTICKNCVNRDRLIDNCIVFTFENSSSVDDEEMREIKLTDSEQAAVREQLEAQCSKRPMKPCAVLLWESETEMIKNYEDH